MKISRSIIIYYLSIIYLLSISLLNLKCELLFQMTKQSFPSSFTPTIGFTLGEKFSQAISVV